MSSRSCGYTSCSACARCPSASLIATQSPKILRWASIAWPAARASWSCGRRPGWERRAVGDKLAATPKLDGFFEVYQVEPERHFVVGGDYAFPNGEPYQMTWAFVLEPVGADATRLITRVRAEATPGWVSWVMGAVVYPPVHGPMQNVQLHNIKQLAERDALRHIDGY